MVFSYRWNWQRNETQSGPIPGAVLLIFAEGTLSIADDLCTTIVATLRINLTYEIRVKSIGLSNRDAFIIKFYSENFKKVAHNSATFLYLGGICRGRSEMVCGWISALAVNWNDKQKERVAQTANLVNVSK